MGSERRILAMGGGGFSMEPHNDLLDRFALSLTGKAKPKACFLPTASGDAEGYVASFRFAFGVLPCEPAVLSLFSPPTADLEGFLLAQDLVYVGGGNTRNLLALWREWGLDGILRKAWEGGVVLAGPSAGGICWFAEGVTDSVPGAFTPLQALGFLPGSFCPHYDSEPGRRPAFHRLLAEGRLAAGFAADDSAALLFEGTRLARVVSSRPQAMGYRVEALGGRIVETPLPAELLGDPPDRRPIQPDRRPV